MKNLIVIILLIFLSGCTGQSNLSIKKSHMRFTSNDFQDGAKLDSRFTCDGDNIRPHLSWSEIPDNAKSLALTCFDPDAPGNGWLHYLVVNMPPVAGELASQDSVPDPGIELPNDFGQVEYGGPCPPSGEHRYIFTLYALDRERIEPADYQEFLQLVSEHTIEQARLTGLYQRRQ